MEIRKSVLFRRAASQVIIKVVLIVLLLLTFIPIFLMLFLSLKSNYQITLNFWALPSPPQFSNYRTALITLLPNVINSVAVVSITTFICLLLASISGYVFARFNFPGKQVLYFLILALLMIPGILTLTPLYKLVMDLKIINTWWALILPWTATGQIMGIMLCRTFIAGQPAALFEAARIDGAHELVCYSRIAVPLMKPILATLAIMNLNSFYNDFIWPLIVINDKSKQVITVAIRILTSSSLGGDVKIGTMVAGFAVASVPLLILYLAGSRLFIEGMTSGAVKM